MAGEGLKQGRDIFPDDHKGGKGKSFNDAMNPPNNPKKDQPPTHYNPNYDYPDYGTPRNPATGGH